MTTVLLRLEGPLQAWATQSKLGIRDTDREPSKSGVLGLVAAALGMDRDDEERLRELALLSLVVRVDRPGSLLRDYHTAGGGTFRGNKKHRVYGAKACVPSQRYFLQDASFVAALGGPEKTIADIAAALRDPRWPLFLGRRACPPSTPVLMGVLEAKGMAALRVAPVAERTPAGALRVVLETDAERGDPRHDVPLSFRQGARRYATRYVRTEWLEPSELSGIAAARGVRA